MPQLKNKGFAPNIGATTYIRKILENSKKDIDSNTFVLGDLNTPCQKNGEIFQTKHQQEYHSIEQCPRSNGLN